MEIKAQKEARKDRRLELKAEQKMQRISAGELLACCFLALLGSTSTTFELFISCLSAAVRLPRERFLRDSTLALSSFFFAVV